jgi:hypothetical protein
MPQRLSAPPFEVERCAALAYVSGRYTPAGPGRGPKAFLGLYLTNARNVPRFSFWSFSTAGERLSFVAVSPDDASLELALFWGQVMEGVPFEQWRPYPIGPSQRKTLKRLRLLDHYPQARRALGAVLYLTRMPVYFSPFDSQLFTVQRRSRAAIRADQAEWQELLESVTPTRPTRRN